MKTFIVTTEAREDGAIGLFYPVTFKVRAFSAEDARDRFMKGIRERNKTLSRYQFYSIQDISPLK